MKERQRARPSLEQLEDRWCPAVTASVKNGILTVSGTPASSADTILVKETAANAFEVDDGSTVVASGLTGVSTVKLALTGSTDVVSVDLGGNTLSGSLTANLGNTNTTLTVADGTISGALRVSGGSSGTDTFTLGGSGTTLTVADDSSVKLSTQAGNSVDVLSGVTLSDDFFASAASVTLESGATVTDTFKATGSTVTVDGTVGGNLDVNGGPVGLGGCGGFGGFGRRGSLFAPFGGTRGGFAGSGSGQTSTALTLGSRGSVGGNLNFSGNGSSDSMDIAGTVSGAANVRLSGSSESATVESGASIGQSANFVFGNGTDSLTVAGTIGTSGYTGTLLTVSVGGGANTLSTLDSAAINGSARIRLGSGTDTVSLQDSATVTGTFTLTGGASSTFHGSTQTNHPTLSLTNFKGTQDSSPNP